MMNTWDITVHILVLEISEPSDATLLWLAMTDISIMRCENDEFE